jgi:hypothetical protein
MSRFLDSRNRNYPLAILYTVLLFLLTSIAVLWQSGVPWIVKIFPASERARFAGALELLIHIVLLSLMFQLIRHISQKKGLPPARLYLLGALSILVFAGSLVYYSDRNAGAMFGHVRQVMSFWMVLLNLYWWTLLVGEKKIGRRVLLLSSGIGLQMTGQVVGDGILVSLVTAADQYLTILLVLIILFSTHFASLAVWYEAFHPKNAQQEEPSLGMALPKIRNGASS